MPHTYTATLPPPSGVRSNNATIPATSSSSVFFSLHLFVCACAIVQLSSYIHHTEWFRECQQLDLCRPFRFDRSVATAAPHPTHTHTYAHTESSVYTPIWSNDADGLKTGINIIDCTEIPPVSAEPPLRCAKTAQVRPYFCGSLFEVRACVSVCVRQRKRDRHDCGRFQCSSCMFWCYVCVCF